MYNSPSGRRHWIRHSQGLQRSFDRDICWSAKNWTRTMYCTKLHHIWAEIWTLSFRGISEYHGIFSKKKKKTLYKCWLSPSRGDLFVSLLSSTKQTRVKFDSANMSPVSHWDEGTEMEDPPSPPSCNPSSSNEPPIKQKAEERCSQAPPQRPLVPLVSMILKQQIKKKIPR